MTATTSLSDAMILQPTSSSWLKRYYGARALFSVVWVALAFTIGRGAGVGIALLVAYPLWDCLANYVDAVRTGGLRRNPTQALNVLVSAVVTLAVVVAIAVRPDLHAAIGVIGIWAGLSGLLQLSTGIRRWRGARGQWPQILSGAQSILAAAHMIARATSPGSVVGAADIGLYAAFGAFYFAVSAATLQFTR
ncbi:DUF308 domain-containing protein [Methylobacterium symbioticum]|uniref:DUF308 domain-containing protein n=1 Tax=Methylobacterium symbioticum TaxID=2584084 RepID=A0A509EFX2_9HYPH|nr:DUF308 domain-containing protein [Methylobacterium symbioticum]VUD72309.1 hypothetical protein MET9862_02904 [Methylobacterium symbioticum]